MKLRLQRHGQGELNQFDLIVITCLEPHFRLGTCTSKPSQENSGYTKTLFILVTVMMGNVFYMCTTDGCVIIICAFSLQTIQEVMDRLEV